MDKLEFLRNQIRLRNEQVEHYNDKLVKLDELKKQVAELENEVANCNCEHLREEINTLNEIALQLDPNFTI